MNGNSNNSQVFLATTALEEFWDTSKPIVFLGEWCLRYSRRAFWEPVGGEVVSHPWKDRNKFSEAQAYISDLYKRLMPFLTRALNDLHNISHGERYWSIVIGPWLLWYLAVLYERYITILVSLEKYPGFVTIGLSEEAFITPMDTLEFMELIKDDRYNLQIYTRALKYLGKKVILKKEETRSDCFRPLGRSKFSNNSITGNISNIVRKLFKNRCLVYARNSYFPRLAEFEIFLKSFGKIWFSRYGGEYESVLLPADIKSRVALQNQLPGKSEFERLIKTVLPLDIPQCYVENFKVVGEIAKRSYLIKPKAIFSANSWYYDEVFKQWSALSAENGVVLLGAQHGGNYGSRSCLVSEEYELSIVDKYFTWGWGRSDYYKKAIPFFATKLTKPRKMQADNKSDSILFATTCTHRYFYQFLGHPDDCSGYLQWQARFIKCLKPELRRKIQLRLNSEDCGWGIVTYWNDICPEAVRDNWKIPFWKSLKRCKLHVCDHLATTFIESLSANKPTVLFWNSVINELKPKAQSFYDSLRDVGILYDTPESAAVAVTAIYEDVELWWNSPNRQKARQHFCDEFARTSQNAVKEWVGVFKQMY